MYQIQVSWPYFSSAVPPLVPVFPQGLTSPPVLVPRVDMLESPREIVVVVEAPGVKTEELRVEVEDLRLLVGGNVRTGIAEENRELTFRYRERAEGPFERAISLPARVDASMAAATYRQGLLTVRLPKAESAPQGPRRISVSHLD